MAGLNHGYSQEMMDDAESSAPCVHQLELQYFCSPDDISYTDLACIGVTSSNGQVFISETWKQEEILSFKEYTTQEKDKLTFTKDMLPLTLLIEPISRVQPIWILKEMLNSIFENIPFNTLNAINLPWCK